MTIDGTSPVSRRAAVGATATVALGGAASLAHASAQGSEPMKKQESEDIPSHPTRNSHNNGRVWSARWTRDLTMAKPVTADRVGWRGARHLLPGDQTTRARLAFATLASSDETSATVKPRRSRGHICAPIDD